MSEQSVEEVITESLPVASPYCLALEELRSHPDHMLKEVGDQWCTPDNIFWGINAMFGPLVLDLFSDGENSKCGAFYTAEDNALTQDWSARLAELNGAAFANPPYSRPAKHGDRYVTGMPYIMKHVSEMREKGGRYVFLIKAATSEFWWPADADHVAFIRGRIGFDLPVWFVPANEKQVATGAFFAGAIAVFDKNWRGPAMSYINRNELEAHGDAFLAQIRKEAKRLLPQMKQPEVAEPVKKESEVEPELPLAQHDILAKSGIEVWGCIRAAFGDKATYTFNESKYAHVWAADSVEAPETVAVPNDVIARAKKIIRDNLVSKGVSQWLIHQPFENGIAPPDIVERLERVAEEAIEDYGMTMPGFLDAMDSIDREHWNNIRHLRAKLSEYRERQGIAA